MRSVFSKLFTIAVLAAVPGLLRAEAVTLEAEAGGLGADWAVSNSPSPAYITITSDGTGSNPGSAARVATYTVAFPTAGTYQLYARLRVGPSTANDDSLFYASSFGTKSPTTDSDWRLVNGLGSVGFSNSTDVVTGSGTLGSGMWKWINLSQFTSQPGFTVSAGNLTQTFQIGARENGLALDKFVFGTAGYTFTVAQLDAGGPGTAPSATIDATRTYQTIEGLGGATAFYAGWITAHPYKQEIYTNAFAGLNLSMLRLGDWYRYQTPLAGFDSAASEIVSNANRVLGHPVPVYMSSWAPPAFLKSNGQVANGGTLIYTNGSFAYSNFAQYWYDSIQAYKSNGVSLAWISIQNEPDWVADYDSCIFHPTEDTVNGTNYASYSKALDAVFQRLSSLPSPPKLLAPETVHIAYNDLRNYAATMNPNSFYGVAHHLYGDSFDGASLGAVTNTFPSKPRFMTEFGLGDMMEQAVLLHNTLVFEQASGYNYWSLVWPGTGGGLIQIENPWNRASWTNAPAGATTQSHGWWIAPAYWSLKHFSYFLQPGYKRVAATCNDPNVLTSAYLSPDGLRLVTVLINRNTNTAATVSFNPGSFAYGFSSVYQTALPNCFASLGAVPGSRQLALPVSSLTTVVLDKNIVLGAATRPSPTNNASDVAVNPILTWLSASNALRHAVFFGTNSNAVATATLTSPEFQGVIDTNSFTAVAPRRGMTYYWRVDEIAYSNTNHGSVWSFSTTPPVPLPSPWQWQDIGAVGVEGSASYSNGVFSASASGADIQGTADAFVYLYVPANGDCTIVARVTSVQNLDLWSKAGVMLRESLAANAANAFVALTPGNGVTWQCRTTTGGSTTYNNTAGLSAPYWIKLVRSGNIFTGYRSPDGTNWTQQGTATFPMAANALVGLALTSHNNTSLCTATFDKVTAPNWSALPGAPGGLTATAGNAQVSLSWTAPSGASSYNVKRATLSGGPYVVLTSVTATNYTDTGLTNGTTYYYVVSALNSIGEGSNSAQVSVKPLAPPTLGVSLADANLVFTWPLVSALFTLQYRTNLALGDWQAVTPAVPQIISNHWQVNLPWPTNTAPMFYRLAK